MFNCLKEHEDILKAMATPPWDPLAPGSLFLTMRPIPDPSRRSSMSSSRLGPSDSQVSVRMARSALSSEKQSSKE